MTKLIGGTTFLHNGVDYDYCFEASITSLLAVCDEVVAVEASSTDDTLDRLRAMQSRDARLRIVSAPWLPAPHDRATNTDWTKDLAEIARKNLTAPVNLYLQGDEVLHEDDYPVILAAAKARMSFSLTRHNFWLDPWHYTPPGRICGHSICRMAPSYVPCSWGSETLDPQGSRLIRATIYHYGFLRNGAGFRKKSEIMHQNFMGTIDPVVYKVEQKGCSALAEVLPAAERIPFKGTHPALIHSWLAERGFNPIAP